MHAYKQINLEEILDIGKTLVIEAGKKTLPYFEKCKHSTKGTVEVMTKADESPVTEVDKLVEQWLCSQLEERFPDFGIQGEEFGVSKKESPNKSPYKWIIDPIDGTKTFITGVPLYTVLLGLFDEEAQLPIAGFIYAPATQELVCAAHGCGAWYNDVRTQVALHSTITDSVLISYDWQAVHKKSPNFINVCHNAKIVRTWGDGFGYLLLATGRVHAVIDPNMHIWDLVPIYPVIIEAAGFVSGWKGETALWSKYEIDTLASCSKCLLEDIQKKL